jgi:hypothetical protein
MNLNLFKLLQLYDPGSRYFPKNNSPFNLNVTSETIFIRLVNITSPTILLSLLN